MTGKNKKKSKLCYFQVEVNQLLEVQEEEKGIANVIMRLGGPPFPLGDFRCPVIQIESN